ncbi:hypothetical protein ACFGVS_18820 [Mucilaginibacter sp. AW1-7]|uniref:hypothetical protein n=1 Tax=unclassified Mucilaginibacter TaxID=2617802 RepID=UPI002365D2B3|nr:hypothetical protein [Mucilaginibacter sp. KACC 22773]WDF77790.1 hypothetical protein PQ469_28290 [Mucilaginibacter sp. KACC 22773]
MSSKCILPLFVLIISCLSVKSQVILNADYAKIKHEVGLKGGRLRRSFIEKNIETNGRYKKVIFSYPLPPEGNSCLMKTIYCLTLKNKCFKYYEDYWGNDLAEKRIADLKIYYPNLKQVKNESRWIDVDNKFEVDLIPKKIGGNNFASAYLLKIKQI